MKDEVVAFRTIVVGAGVVFVSLVALFFVLFRDASTSISRPLIVAFSFGFLFLIAAFFIVARLARFFRREYMAQDDGARFKSALITLGGVPLKALALFILLAFVYLFALYLGRQWIGLRSGIGVSIFFYSLSLAMISAAFIYVLSDKLVSKSLLLRGFTHYPMDLRESRQRSKTLIIPSFMSLMSLVFAFSIVFLAASDKGISIETGTLVRILTITACYFVMTTILVIVWTSNTALIFKSIILQLEALLSAEKDLSKRISIGSVDELGTIAGMVNTFCSGLSDNIVSLKESQQTLNSLGEDLRKNASDAAGAVSQISVNAERSRDKTHAQSSSVAESSSAVHQIARNIEALDRLIADQSASVTEASASIEEMVGNISSVTVSIHKMAEQFASLLSSAESGKKMQSAAGERIRQISERSQSLLAANKVIANIASQTNLLAMNAAIEAAHAGSAGRGFSVVADEIRRLAENSAKQSSNIKTELGQVQQAIEEVVSSSQDSEQAFSQVAEQIGETDALVQEVKMAMEEQREGSIQVLEALKSMNDVTSQVRSGSHEMNAGNNMVLEEIARLQNSALEIKNNIEEMAIGTEGIATGTKKVSEMADVTRDTIRKMHEAIDCFKTSK